MGRFSSALARFAEASGKANLYNETVTWAFLSIIRERMARLYAAPTWREFAGANQDLLVWENSVLKKYYRPETRRSEFAKKVSLFPDDM